MHHGMTSQNVLFLSFIHSTFDIHAHYYNFIYSWTTFFLFIITLHVSEHPLNKFVPFVTSCAQLLTVVPSPPFLLILPLKMLFQPRNHKAQSPLFWRASWNIFTSDSYNTPTTEPPLKTCLLTWSFTMSMITSCSCGVFFGGFLNPVYK